MVERGETFVTLGVVTGAHGVKGALRVKYFTEAPGAIAAYGPVTARRPDGGIAGVWSVVIVREIKGGVVIRAEGITDRDTAAALRGTELVVARSALPPLEDGVFYQADLIGLEVCEGGDADGAGGKPWGRVRAVHNFGAGDVVEIEVLASGGTEMIPLAHECVGTIDLDRGFLVATPLEEI